MAKTFPVKESAARKLATELGEKDKTKNPSKLTKYLNELSDNVNDLDDDLVESLSKGSSKLLEKIVEAVGNKQKVVIASESNGEEESPKAKAAKNGKPTKKEPREPGVVSKKTQQGQAITSVVTNAKGPMTTEEIHAKANKKVPMSVARVQGHMNYMEEKGKVTKQKGGKYAITG